MDQSGQPPRSLPCLLIVVAQLQLRAAVRQCIDRQPAACRCIEAASGEEAELVCRSQPIELVLLDLHLPGISAFDTTRRIKAAQPACQVVLLAEPFEAAWLSFDPQNGASGCICKEPLRDELDLLLPIYLERCGGGSALPLADDRGRAR